MFLGHPKPILGFFVGLACSGCRTSTPPAPSAIEDAFANVENDATADAGESALSTYSRREWSIRRGGGDLVFESPGKTHCAALPETKPAGFVVYLIRRGGEGGDWTYFGVTDTLPCRFAWGMPWMDPPPAACKVVSTTEMDRLYRELRQLSIPTIRTRTLEGISPHRGGFGVAFHYGDHECEVSDILNSEVLNEDQKRFDAALDLVRRLYQEQEKEDAGGG